MRITFVTGNKGKLHEAQTALAPSGHEVVGSDLHPVEIQGETLEEISRAKCDVLVGKLAPPFFVDDGGLFVHALRDFPGVFSAHALKTIGVQGILKLMEGVADRGAHFACVVSYHDGRALRSFSGRCEGALATAPRSSGHGFGFDPIFVPEGHGETFGELDAAVKNAISHRGKALAQLVAHLRRG
ncbi:MAG TPA: RdgB/HAM1 family non-canonical purine NTP pyrophosphatase [Candidatus Thermoplasmatota archaeon]|nr:RdgB/HAM1 family non-canonical purine NTP pyrophosphatase [Candidatus Thermoplasmatota archaeon]